MPEHEKAIGRRSSTELFQRPLIATQQHLLTPSAFISAARERGIRFLDEGHLEQLDRESLLRPFLRVRLGRRSQRPPSLGWPTTTFGSSCGSPSMKGGSTIR